MALVGMVEQVSPHGVWGWAFDDISQTPVILDLRINGRSLFSVRADGPRPDLRISRGRFTAGFWFGIGESLLRALPQTCCVAVSGGADPLPFASGCPRDFAGKGAQGFERLDAEFAQGKSIGAKYGNMIHPIGSRTDWQRRVLDAYALSRDLMMRLTGRSLMLGYGTLLGWRRSDAFIAHDDDFDAICVIDAVDVPDFVRQMRQVLDRLTSHGCSVAVASDRQFYWQHADDCSIDVFFCWRRPDHLHMVYMDLPTSETTAVDAVPATFRGRHVLVPRNPDLLLSTIYGAGWRDPDPLFQHSVSPAEAKVADLIAHRSSAMSR